MPTALLGASRSGGAVVKRGAAVLTAALLFGHGSLLQAAPAEPPSQTQASAPSPELRAAVVSLLERPDVFPPYEARWRPLGPAAFGVLDDLASNPNAPSPQRIRAVTSMAAVDHPQSAGHLRTMLEDSHLQSPLRASAATALSLRAGSEAVPALLPFLQDRDGLVRVAVARALGRLGGPQAQQALEERIPSEEDPAVREVLQQALSFVEP
ncbi:HEAT repeat domain-containing protein [Hyalangium versicolor]|uniref:HEAT repeat domain-containing protein n=1 Tax=Hyalangium versicolor TaxID=2861190 RepID=UPI001CCEAE28|nr:HEAT repeat domain-containing protein [Hyalangium versicolor]